MENTQPICKCGGKESDHEFEEDNGYCFCKPSCTCRYFQESVDREHSASVEEASCRM